MPSYVPAAARALAVFETFAKTKREMSNSELAKALGLAESSCSDLVSTLIDIGYLSRSATTRRLYPTGRLQSIANDIDQDSILLERLNEACERIRDATSESAMCGTLTRGVALVLAFQPGRDRLRYTSAKGDEIQLHISSMAKAILCHMSDVEVEKAFKQQEWPRLTPYTITDPLELTRQVASFRSKGYVFLENEGSEGLATMSIAGRVNGKFIALCVAGTLQRLQRSTSEYLAALRQAGQDLFDKP